MVRSKDEPSKKSKYRRKEKPKEESDHEEDDRQSNAEEGLDQVENAILDLREKGKKDPDFDYNKELRKIQDQISDLKGVPRRPVTGLPESSKKKKKKKNVKIVDDHDDKEYMNGHHASYHEDQSDDDASMRDESDDDVEEDESDDESEIKDIVNKRLTTCMLLALSFERKGSYPEDFYEKLAESDKFDKVTEPISKEEVKLMNKFLKERKKEAKKRVGYCSK